MKHLSVVLLIIGLLIGTLFLFKDELFFNKHKTINNFSQKEENKVSFKNKEKEENSKTKIENISSQKSTSTEITSLAKKKNSSVIEEVKAKIKHLEKQGDKVKVMLDKNGESITAYMEYDYDLYILLEDSMKHNLPLIFVIKKENDKVYIEEIK